MSYVMREAAGMSVQDAEQRLALLSGSTRELLLDQGEVVPTDDGWRFRTWHEREVRRWVGDLMAPLEVRNGHHR